MNSSHTGGLSEFLDLSQFGSALESLSFGASDVNPKAFIENCVSVTCAKVLEYRDVHALWKAVYGGDLPDAPLSIAQMADLLKRARWSCTWKEYSGGSELSAYDKVQKDLVKHNVMLGPFRAALYRPAKGTGHCVVSGSGVASDGLCEEDPRHIEFTCYQRETTGQDVMGDIRRANEIVMLFFESPHKDSEEFKAWQDRALRNVENKTELWSEASFKRIGFTKKDFALEREFLRHMMIRRVLFITGPAEVMRQYNRGVYMGRREFWTPRTYPRKRESLWSKFLEAYNSKGR